MSDVNKKTLEELAELYEETGEYAVSKVDGEFSHLQFTEWKEAYRSFGDIPLSLGLVPVAIQTRDGELLVWYSELQVDIQTWEIEDRVITLSGEAHSTTHPDEYREQIGEREAGE